MSILIWFRVIFIPTFRTRLVIIIVRDGCVTGDRNLILNFTFCFNTFTLHIRLLFTIYVIWFRIILRARVNFLGSFKRGIVLTCFFQFFFVNNFLCLE